MPTRPSSQSATLPAVGTFEEYRDLPPDGRAQVVRTRSVARETRPSELPILLLMLGRPRTCVPGLLAYAFGFSYAEAPFSPKVILGALLAFLIGFSANLHNTYTDLDEDARNLPGRGWLLARFGMPRLLVSLAAIDAFMIASSALISTEFLIVMVFAVVFPFMFGWLTERHVSTLLSRPSYVAMMIFLFLWFVAKGMFKNVPDFYGDRTAGQI